MDALYSSISAVIKNSPAVYFRAVPHFNDFTKSYQGDFIISSPTKSIQFSSKDIGLPQRLPTFWNFLRLNMFCKGRRVITWDIKKFISYLRCHLKMPLEAPEATVMDLKYGKAFLGHRNFKAPETFSGAFEATQDFITKKEWKRINEKIYEPLAFQVLPALETRGIVDVQQNKKLYSCYEIEGQVNGRLLVPKPSSCYLTVHSMTPRQKSSLLPGGKEDSKIFILLDFNHMEAKVLQWLSKDEELGKALLDKDFYASLVTFDCKGQDKHKLGKLVFLPIIYGMQAPSLAKRLQISEYEADQIITRQQNRFAKSFSWIIGDLVEHAVIKDYLGRQRDFTGEPLYKQRNFKVQSPAALICLEKLCKLHDALPNNVLMHIHDGYVLVADKPKCAAVISKATSILQSESELCSGLTLEVSCHVGSNLNELKAISLKR